MNMPTVEWGPLPKNCKLPSLLGGPSETETATHWVGAAWTDCSQTSCLVVAPKFEFLKAGLMLADVISSKAKLVITNFDENKIPLDKKLVAFRVEGDDKRAFLKFDPSGKQIELPTMFAEEFLLVQVVAFVNTLSDLLERRRRVDRNPVQRSFDGQIRGRLNIAKSVQRHWGAGESTKVVCDLTDVSPNIPLNQVLLEALKRCLAYLAKIDKDKEVRKRLEHKIRRTYLHLHGVEKLSDRSQRHLAIIRNSLRGYYAIFKPVFDMAKCMILNEQFVIQPETSSKNTSMSVPFGVNMDALFELYIRAQVDKIKYVKLEEVENLKVWNQYDPKPSAKDKFPERRPDIMGTKQGNRFIIEVKYYTKDWLQTLKEDEKNVMEGHARPREGFFQIVSYMHLFDASLGIVVFPSDNPSTEFPSVVRGSLGCPTNYSAGELAFVRVGKMGDIEDNLQTLLKS